MRQGRLLGHGDNLGNVESTRAGGQREGEGFYKVRRMGDGTVIREAVPCVA
jgi:hypothetical protein